MTDLHTVEWTTTAADLRRDGFCVIPGVLEKMAAVAGEFDGQTIDDLVAVKASGEA